MTAFWDDARALVCREWQNAVTTGATTEQTIAAILGQIDFRRSMPAPLSVETVLHSTRTDHILLTRAKDGGWHCSVRNDRGGTTRHSYTVEAHADPVEAVIRAVLNAM